MANDEAYREAVKKIEIVQDSGKTKLDLSVEFPRKHQQLTKLPELLKNLTQLQRLDLSNNNLTDLPEWLSNLTQLQWLDLSGNNLTELPKSLKNLTQLQWLDLSSNNLTELPESLSNLTQLQHLSITDLNLRSLPEWFGQLSQLEEIRVGSNQLTSLPKSMAILKKLKTLLLSGGRGETNNSFRKLPSVIRKLTALEVLWIECSKIELLPEWLYKLERLRELRLSSNQITDLPLSLTQLEHLRSLDLRDNPLNPELAAAFAEGLKAVKAYLRAKATEQITLNEAKLILIGEGAVGKSCLLDALCGEKFVEGLPTTHGIQIKPFKVTDPDSKKEITLNGWDFGGQRVYRPTHQLFFSAPAVYLVVWKPREGLQQGLVMEWLKLVKHREPDAKILVVATHGGPQQRQPDINRQEIWDLFGKDTVLDFMHVDSKPDKKTGEKPGIEDLKQAIARVASTLPEMGRSVPKRWQDVRASLAKKRKAYLPIKSLLELCRDHGMDDDEAHLFVKISHRLGHLIHYEHDPTLRDIVVLKPDWLATAISFVLDDEETRKANGLVKISRLSQLWNSQTREKKIRYSEDLHPIFIRLMERFDLSYRVAALPSKDDLDTATLIAQLVPDIFPAKALKKVWSPEVAAGDIKQVQICRIVDALNGQSATAEGLFYLLIVRLHKYSLGRMNYKKSVHWQRGLVLDDDYNGRALLEYIGNDVSITVQAPYPERFLAMLTGEVKYLVESFWEGLRCNVMVPCVDPCGRDNPGTGLYEVEKLIDSKRRGKQDYPCTVCNEWQDIDSLLRNAPAARPLPIDELLVEFVDIKRELVSVRKQLVQQRGRFDQLDFGVRLILSKVDAGFSGLMQAFTDEAKEGPRLFSLIVVGRSKFNPSLWLKRKFKLTLWCEHSKLPLPCLNGKDSKKGVYEIEFHRRWFKECAPYLKVMTGTLRLVLPVAASVVKLALDDNAYKAIEEELDFGKEIIDAALIGSEKIADWIGDKYATSLEHGESIRAQAGTLRNLHAVLKEKDPSFGGLVRVMNKRKEYLWVHKQFRKEY